jgi:hypothetical protein
MGMERGTSRPAARSTQGGTAGALLDHACFMPAAGPGHPALSTHAGVPDAICATLSPRLSALNATNNVGCVYVSFSIRWLEAKEPGDSGAIWMR